MVAALVMLGTVGSARRPTHNLNRADRGAARDLVAGMRQGERGHWLVTFEFTRKLANGRVLTQAMHEGRVPSLRVLTSGTSMTVEKRAEHFDCNLVGERSECSPTATGRVLPPSEVLRVSVAAGAYGVERRPAETIAGERARCFRVRATGPATIPDLGAATDLCVSDDGIVLRQRVEKASGDVDERVARSVRRGVTMRAIEAVIRDFDPRGAG